ncbi:MAG: 2-isopropylmalate synthase, partial [Aquificota bacterium]
KSYQEVKLQQFQIVSGDKAIPTATVKLLVDGDEIVSTSCGDGPVDSALKAVESAVGVKSRLKDYSIRSLSHGKDAMGEVRVIVLFEDEEVSGKGISTDIIEASVKAYLDAYNRFRARKTFVEQRIKEGI